MGRVKPITPPQPIDLVTRSDFREEVGRFPHADTLRLRRALRDRVDPVFLPRPFHLVASLPRNETGKLPRARLLAMARQLATDASGPTPANPTGQSR